MGGRRSSFNYSQTDPKILEMYDKEGLSLNEIASRLQLYVMQVKRRLEAMGVEIRDRNEAVLLYHRLNKGVRKAVGPKRVQPKKKAKKGKVRGSKKAKKRTRRTEEADDGGGGSKGKKAVGPLRRRRFRHRKGQE